MFVNFSNHPSADWSSEQKQAAGAYGEITDFSFPAVSASASEAEICAQAQQIVAKITQMRPAAVLCQGEFTLSFAITAALLRLGIPVLAACSERQSETVTQPDGTTVKKAVFRFVKFRRYTDTID